MTGFTRAPRILLPNGWSQRVRSAVIYAISLAHFSLTSTRSWAANNWNARIRLNHLRRLPRRYLVYYHTCRTHLSLEKDSPEPRRVEPPEYGSH